MQLDFLFAHQNGGGGTATTPLPGRCKLKALATEATRRGSFAVAGSPLSDHYGLSTSFAVEVDQ